MSKVIYLNKKEIAEYSPNGVPNPDDMSSLYAFVPIELAQELAQALKNIIDNPYDMPRLNSGLLALSSFKEAVK